MKNNIFNQPYNKQLFLKTYKKVLTLYVPAQEAKTVSNLNQSLVKAGLNFTEFCEKFNKLTANFPVGVIVPISIFYTPKEKNFEICIRPLQLKHILQQYIKLDNQVPKRYYITALDLYKVLLIKAYIINEKNLTVLFRSILGTLRSYEFPVEILFSIDDIKEMVEQKIIDSYDYSVLKHLDIGQTTMEQKEENNLKNPETNEEIPDSVIIETLEILKEMLKNNTEQENNKKEKKNE